MCGLSEDRAVHQGACLSDLLVFPQVGVRGLVAETCHPNPLPAFAIPGSIVRFIESKNGENGWSGDGSRGACR